MASKKAIEARNERNLRLLLKEDSNRHCVDCGGFGPQYVVCKFSVFVCSSCSGVHRLFGHRVKGVSLCTFTSEEVEALQRGGNQVFQKTFCGSMPHDVTRPVESSTESIKRWIEDVYVSKKYYKDVAESRLRPPPLETLDTGDVAVIPLADVLGADTPILRFTMESGDDKSHKSFADTATKQEETRKKDEEISNHHQSLEEWDPFGVSSSASPSIEQPVEETSCAVEETVKSSEMLVEKKEEDPPFDAEWEAFALEQQSSPAEDTPAPSTADIHDTLPVVSVAVVEEKVSHRDEIEEAQKQETKEPHAAPAPIARPEVPLDAFYPEFSKIRETGILPTGKPVPWHMRPQQDVMVNKHEQVQHMPPPIVAAPSTQVPHPHPPRASPTPQYNKAAKTLYGTEKNLTAYDLSSQHAPKPNTTGNPFA